MYIIAATPVGTLYLNWQFDGENFDSPPLSPEPPQISRVATVTRVETITLPGYNTYNNL